MLRRGNNPIATRRPPMRCRLIRAPAALESMRGSYGAVPFTWNGPRQGQLMVIGPADPSLLFSLLSFTTNPSSAFTMR